MEKIKFQKKILPKFPEKIRKSAGDLETGKQKNEEF